MSLDPLSLHLLQSTYLLEQIKNVAQPPGLYALLVDKYTEDVLNAVIPKATLLRVVTSVERIDARRRLSPFLQGIYLCEPLVFNLNCIVADVVTGRYKSGHLLFLPFSEWDEAARRVFELSKFLGNPKVEAYFDEGHSINFVHASMVPVELRIFLADNTTPNSMAIYYNENCGDLVLPQVRRAARAIVNAVVVAGEYPFIRFLTLLQSQHPAARLPELIADEVQRQLDDYARSNHDYPPASAGDKPRAVLLITDRTLDLYAPLLHEFSYQAIAHDIVESLERKNIYEYTVENELGEPQKLETSLDIETDALWVQLRHMHIIEALELVINKISELIRNNPMMMDRQKAKTSADLMYVVAHLQGFDDERRLVTLHKTLIDECLDINATRKLAEFAADFEQTCAAEGTSFEGVRNKHLADDLIVLLARDDLHVNDKMRLVLIYALYRGGLCEADFIKLAKFIGVEDRQIVSLVSRCFINLRKLGFPIVKPTPEDKPVIRQTFHTINNDGTYNTSRFSPGLKRVLHNMARHELDEDWFPYFRDKPLEQEGRSESRNGTQTSLRNTRIKASWAQGSVARSGSALAASARNRQKIFCYVAGGITHSEMRSVYELSSSLNKEFYLGSETISCPRDFLIGLQSIDDNKTPQLLELPLWKEISTAPSLAPDYLFEIPKPKVQPTPAPQVASSTASTNASASAQKNGFGLRVPNPQFSPGKVSADAPRHYQKRTNQYTTDLSGESEKEKKPSRLKRLFK